MQKILLTLLLIPSLLIAENLKPFESDGCSAFPDGTLNEKRLWLNCCTAHDLSYWKGGTYEERKYADRELEQCVAEVGEPEVALLMLLGVRVGGTPFLPAKFRWGYGWPYLRGYKALNAQEKNTVKTILGDN